MNIGVIGVGRLGICFSLLLDRAGYSVLGCDIRSSYIAALQKREIHTAEPGVPEMLATCNIDFTTDTRRVIQNSDVIYVMVATPSLADGSYDISAVRRVVDDVAECDFDLNGKLLVIGCTTNPGDCQRIQDRLRERGVAVLYNPEFIAQGSIIRDLEQADMVLIGGEDSASMECYKLLYNDIQTTEPKIHVMSLTAAEIVKIGVNCFLTTKISYANMVGEVLIRSGLEQDVDAALGAIGADSRVGSRYMKYGFGFGGPCLPRDNRAFAHYARSQGSTFPLGDIVDQFNQDHTKFLVDQAIRANQSRLPFYISSITYKPNTDIVEESQQLKFVIELLQRGYTVYVEPNPLLPNNTVQDLAARFAKLEFSSAKELQQRGIEVFKVCY
jgi:nucleotide sugar dehydrogenase